MAYVALDALKKTLTLSGETFADDDLELALDAATAAVDSLCGRRFTLDATDHVRTYEPTRVDWLEIDDLVELTSVEADLNGEDVWTAWSASDYRLAPRNASADGEPYTELRLSPNSTVPNFNLSYGPQVRITGKFGWPAVPNAVEAATGILAARLVKRAREAPFGVAGIGTDGFGIRISYVDPDVKMLLSPYTRPVRLG